MQDKIRRRLRQRFGISLSRLDCLARLDRWPEGLKMAERSRCLMLTGGNVTGLTVELARDGRVQRVPSATDRRRLIVCLTAHGRDGFEAMAREHAQWILALFIGPGASDLPQLHPQLGAWRPQLAPHRHKPPEPPS